MTNAEGLAGEGHSSTPNADREEIRSRLDAHRRTGDSDFLWPDLPGEERRAAMGQIRRVTAEMIREPSASTRLSVTSAHEARVLGIAAFTAGMGPLLGWWMEKGSVSASPEAQKVFALHLSHGRLRSRRLRAQAALITRTMHGAGIRPILLKGMHTGAEFFPDHATRPTADIDILVPTEQRAPAERVLSSLGLQERSRLLYDPRSDWSLPNDADVVSIDFDHAENPWHVDLHTGLGRRYFRGLRVDLGSGALITSRTARVGGEEVRVLDQPYLTAFLAIHAGCDLSTIRLIRLIELVLVIRADLASRRLDWADLRALLDQCAAGHFAYPALALAEELAAGTVDPDLLGHYARRATPRMNRVLSVIRDAEMGPLHERSLDIKLAWALNGAQVLGGLSEVLFPAGSGGIGATLAQRLSLMRWRVARRVPGLRRRRSKALTRDLDSTSA